MSEIKIESGPIQQAITDLKSVTESFTTSFIEDMTGQNKLEMVNKLNEINTTINNLQKSYQALLLKNAQTTGTAVETMEEREQAIASSIKHAR